MDRQLISKLTKAVLCLQSDMERNIKHLNGGGCGVFALEVCKELKKYGIDSRLAILDGNIEDFNYYKKEVVNDILNNNYVDTWDARNTSFAHCCLILDDGLNFDGEQFDAIQDWQNGGYALVGEYLPMEMKIALKYGGWNELYDRRQNKLVKKLIKQNFKKYLA